MADLTYKHTYLTCNHICLTYGHAYIHKEKHEGTSNVTIMKNAGRYEARLRPNIKETLIINYCLPQDSAQVRLVSG